MTRSTSKAVYWQILDEGLLSKLRTKIYKWLYQHGPATGREIGVGLELDSNTVTPRMAELRRLGVVSEQGEKTCKVTNRNVIAWDVTTELPIKNWKKVSSTPTRKQLFLKIRELEAENLRLQKHINSFKSRPRAVSSNQVGLFTD